ncbi:hypothetical protein TrRE_jg4859, partial [Triparma retinervis]
YALKKFSAYISWRIKSNVEELLSEGQSSDLSTEFLEGAVYWHGVDTLGRPILWENFGAMDFRNFDSARKIRFYILLFEAVYKVMPEGVTQFTVVADSKSLPYAR